MSTGTLADNVPSFPHGDSYSFSNVQTRPLIWCTVAAKCETLATRDGHHRSIDGPV